MYAGASYSAAPYASSAEEERIWSVRSATSIARARNIDYLTYWNMEPARSAARAYPLTFNEVWLIGSSSASAKALPIEIAATGTAPFDLTVANTTARAHLIHWLRWFDIQPAHASASANPFSWLSLLNLQPATAVAKGLAVDFSASGLIDFEIEFARATVRGFAVDLDYVPITTIPELVVTWKDSESAEIDVLQPVNAQLSLIRADNYLASFGDPVMIGPGELPYTDSGLDREESYMYRASYTIEGEKGGEPVVIEGEPSGLRILIGKNRTL